jgi:MoaA/NifB/PqqE/SkfB family radical SAM enzyme
MMETHKTELVSRYLYRSPYVVDVDAFRRAILAKTFVPKQVEVQPGPLGKSICWLSCPYCYGKSAINTEERLPLPRYVEILRQIMGGGCRKFVFAGWATDPLYYRHIDDLVEAVSTAGSIIGFNTRAIDVSDRLVDLVTAPTVAADSYMSISVNAATNERYNQVNGVPSGTPRIYDRVLANVAKITAKRRETGARLDISVSYLLNSFTAGVDEVRKFIRDFRDAGADVIRFSCPQIPRGDAPGTNEFVPTAQEYAGYIADLEPVVASEAADTCSILLSPQEDMYRHARTLPCFARFIYPTIGYDGWLYHCSQSAGVNFRSQALGNLATHDFWDLMYNYDPADLPGYFRGCASLMEGNGCRCDRKEHTVNASLRDSGSFDDVR